MKNNIHLFLLILFAAGPMTAPALYAQGLKNLENNNGFKKYKLGTKYNKVYGIKNKQEDGSEKVVINYTTDMIGDIPVKQIDLFYISDTLSKIIVRVAPEYAERLIEACRGSFGNPSVSNGNKNDSTSGNTSTDRYIWKTKRFSMEYFYSFPKYGGANQTRDLHLNYSLNDFDRRIGRIKKGNISARDF